MNKQIIYSDKVLKPVGPYSQAIAISPNGNEDGLIFISGLVGIDPKTGVTPDNVAGQTKIIMESMKSILETAKSSMDKVVKTTIFLTNVEDYEIVNDIYASFFSNYPDSIALHCSTCIVVSKLVKPEFRIEIEAIVHK